MGDDTGGVVALAVSTSQARICRRYIIYMICIKCNSNTKIVDLPKDISKRKLKPNQKYYFTRYIKCNECGFHQNLESHKIIVGSNEY